jgi:adenylate kinase
VVFVHFKADDETCIQRVCQRLVCVNCYASFNMVTRRSAQDKVCDECNAVLEVRLGDDVSNVIKRLGNYSRYIEPLLDLVKDEYTVMVIDAEKPLTDCLDMYSSLPV